MNVNFIEFSRYPMTDLGKNFISSLSAQHKKILVVVSIAFAFLAALYAAGTYSIRVKKNAKNEEKKDSLNSEIEVDGVKDTNSTKAQLSKLENERKELDKVRLQLTNEKNEFEAFIKEDKDLETLWNEKKDLNQLKAELEADQKKFAEEQAKAKIENDKKESDQEKIQKALDETNAKLIAKQRQLELKEAKVGTERTKLDQDQSKFDLEKTEFEKFKNEDPQHALWLEKKQLEQTQTEFEVKEKKLKEKISQLNEEKSEIKKKIKSMLTRWCLVWSDRVVNDRYYDKSHLKLCQEIIHSLGEIIENITNW